MKKALLLILLLQPLSIFCLPPVVIALISGGTATIGGCLYWCNKTGGCCPEIDQKNQNRKQPESVTEQPKQEKVVKS